MTQHIFIKFSILATAIYGMLVFQLFGQVVTPSLNIVTKPILPAASSWLKQGTVAGEYRDGNGKRKLDGEEIYAVEVEGSRGNLAFSLGNVDIDVYGDETRFETAFEATTDASSDGYYLDNISETYVGFSLTGQGDVAVGFAIHEVNTKIFLLNPKDEPENFKQSGVIGSFSLKATESIYLGGGVERIKETSSLTVDNEWTEATGGLAIWVGQNTDSQFRIELSLTQSPEAKSEVDQPPEPVDPEAKLSAKHSGSTTTRINVELMMNGLLFSYSNRNEVIDEESIDASSGESVDKTEKNMTEGSIQWVPSEGLVLGFAFSSFENKAVFTDKLDTFRVNLGYIF